MMQALKAVRDLFGPRRKVKALDYNEAVEALAEKGDGTALAAKRAAFTSTGHRRRFGACHPALLGGQVSPCRRATISKS